MMDAPFLNVDIKESEGESRLYGDFQSEEIIRHFGLC